jgi:hypothetical protein
MGAAVPLAVRQGGASGGGGDTAASPDTSSAGCKVLIERHSFDLSAVCRVSPHIGRGEPGSLAQALKGCAPDHDSNK